MIQIEQLSNNYASPPSWDAFCDRQLTPTFELIFFCDCMFEIVSVCPYPEKRNYPRFVNTNSTVVSDTWLE